MKTKETNCLNPNCKKELIHTQGRRPKKYCSPVCRNAHYKVIYEPKKKVPVAGTIQLPKDFINVDKVAIIKADGTIHELKTADQLPYYMQLTFRAMKELKQDVGPKSRTNSGLIKEFDSKINYQPTTEQSFDGERLATHIQDEHPMYDKGTPSSKEDIQKAIDEYELEVKGLGAGILAKQRRRFVEGKIVELKRQLKS